MTPLPEPVLAMLAQPNPCVIAVAGTDGAPTSAAVWYLWDDGEVLTSMNAAGARRRRLERDPRVSLTVLAADSWYRQVTLQGEVVSLTDDPGFTDIDRISRHYSGEPFDHGAVLHATARIRIDRWNQFGFDV